MQETTKTFDELNLEQLRKAAFEHAAPVGAEFLPPHGQQVTAEQIADFNLARGEWTEKGKTTFPAA